MFIGHLCFLSEMFAYFAIGLFLSASYWFCILKIVICILILSMDILKKLINFLYSQILV